MRGRGSGRTKGWCDDDLGYEPSIMATEIIVTERDDVVNTGLLDQYGEPIRRRTEKLKMGFVR